MKQKAQQAQKSYQEFGKSSLDRLNAEMGIFLWINDFPHFRKSSLFDLWRNNYSFLTLKHGGKFWLK